MAGRQQGESRQNRSYESSRPVNQVSRANRADDGSTPSADCSFIHEGTEVWTYYHLYRIDSRPTVIRALTFDGQELWSRTFTEPMIKDVAADTQGA
jgi:hypothetical protein